MIRWPCSALEEEPLERLVKPSSSLFLKHAFLGLKGQGLLQLPILGFQLPNPGIDTRLLAELQALLPAIEGLRMDLISLGHFDAVGCGFPFLEDLQLLLGGKFPENLPIFWD